MDIQKDFMLYYPELGELKVLWFRETETELQIAVSYNRPEVLCPFCKGVNNKEHGREAQRKRDRNLERKKVFFILSKRRFRCLDCNKVFTEPDELFGSGKRSSKRFRTYLGKRAAERDVREVAIEEKVSVSMVRNCLHEVWL